MSFLDDLPMYIVFAAVLINLIIGVRTDTGFIELMIRSIITTIVFSIFGYILSGMLKKTIVVSRQNNAKQTMKNEPTIDIKVPPVNDELLSNLSQQGDEDEFTEMNPAYLHSYKQKEENK